MADTVVDDVVLDVHDVNISMEEFCNMINGRAKQKQEEE